MITPTRPNAFPTELNFEVLPLLMQPFENKKPIREQGKHSSEKMNPIKNPAEGSIAINSMVYIIPIIEEAKPLMLKIMPIISFALEGL